MLRSIVALTFGLSLALLVSASTQYSELNDVPLSEHPSPTSPPLAFTELHPSLSWGSVPVNKTSVGSQRHSLGQIRLNRVDLRQIQCAEPGYILVCPIKEDLPCCHPGFPVCCHDPSDICCPSGTFCQGVKTCCLSGSVGCGEGCCGAGTTCCGTNCCLSGWTCQDGTCVDPQVSKRQVQSVSKVQSTQSVSSVSSIIDLRVSTASANPDTINTARVLPSDPRIEYNSSTYWVDTTQDSGAGSCTNGTRVAKVVGASFTFAFSGLSVSIQTAVNTGPVNYTVIIDGRSAVASNSATAFNQCHVVTSFTRTGLLDVQHTLKVVASGRQAGKLEFAGIIYTGKDAFDTPGGGGDNLAVVVGGAVGGAIGFLLFVVLGFWYWILHKNKKQQKGEQQKGLQTQQPGSSPGAPPIPGAPPMNQSSYGGSGESFPGTVGHEQPHSPGQNLVPQSVGSRTSSTYPPPTGVPPGMLGQNARPSSADPLRGGPLLVQPAVAVSPSTRQEAISPAHRLSATPSPTQVEQARNSATSPSQHTRTTASSNRGPDPVTIQRQPNVGARHQVLQRPQSIHDPRYYTAADMYDSSSPSQGRDGS